MRCRECEATATEYPLMARRRVKIVCQDANDRVICSGYTSDEANKSLPKTSPRWCPRRKCNQQHMVVVARVNDKEGNTDA